MKNRFEMEKRIAMAERLIPYNHRLAPIFIRDSVFSMIPKGTQHIFVVGIGSNLINGDSLGPFVGTLLIDLYPDHLTVLGNLQNPLDATTLVPEFSRLSIPKNSFVIAVDSVLGTKGTVKSIVVREGALLPGAGLGNDLPPIGDCNIMGIVQENHPDVENTLPFTNLNLIFTMATNIAKGISLAVRQYFHYPLDFLHNGGKQ